MAVKGTFKDISFIEFLQLMHLTRKTGRLEVSHENKWAMVIFREGTIWHVEPRGFRGASSEEILLQLIQWLEGNFVFQRLQVLPMLERTVHISTESLIMEGAKRMDDEAAVAEQVGGELRNILKLKPGAEAKVRYVPQNVKRVLQAIDGQRNIADVIKQSQLESNQAAQIIRDLIAQGILDQSEPERKDANPLI